VVTNKSTKLNWSVKTTSVPALRDTQGTEKENVNRRKLDLQNHLRFMVLKEAIMKDFYLLGRDACSVLEVYRRFRKKSVNFYTLHGVS
jgi:hypothetical protein